LILIGKIWLRENINYPERVIRFITAPILSNFIALGLTLCSQSQAVGNLIQNSLRFFQQIFEDRFFPSGI